MEQRIVHEEHASHVHHGLSATEELKQEHRIIERVLAVLERLVQKPLDGSSEDWQKALDFIRGFADQCHHLKEEKLLFPALEEHGIPREGGPIGMMLAEHEEGRGYVREMAKALAGEDDPEVKRTALIENATAYLRLLREHIRKEDEILFPMGEEVLGSEELRKLAVEFAKHEAEEIGVGVHEKFLKIVEELEKRVS